MSGTCAVFVGDGSLLIQCAEAYASAGHRLQAVASHADAVLAWAAQKNIPAIRLQASAPLALADLSGLEFDYLFNIASLQILPASVMARARKLALNFHDSLLPRYAGLHASSWALMAQEVAHGVTWHEMTPAVDAGRIVRQVRFDIAPDETAVSLNTKCYDAGLSSFVAIVQDLEHGDLPLTEQSGTRSYFGARKRPDWLATLDFSRPAQELEALVRALDFGPYPNGLVCPKIYLGGKVLYVRAAHAIPALSQALPGTVLGVQGDALRIATGEGDIFLEAIHDVAGPVVAHELAPGPALPALSEALRGRLASAILGAAQGESFWRKAFSGLAALELPYPRKVAQPGLTAFQPVCLPLNVPACASQSVAGFFSWLSALTGQQTISALYCDDALAAQADGIEPWLCPWVPLTLTLDAQASARQAQALASAHIHAMRQAGPYLCDLPLRLGAKQSASVPPLHIGVSMSRRAKPDKADLLLTVDATGDKLELIADSAVFTPETMHAMAAHLAAYLQAFGNASGGGAGSASCCVAAIALMPEAEAQLLTQLNATAAPYDEALCVHEAVSAQAARTPDQTALSAQGRSLSYRELDAAATALARRLVARGVRPGDIVGICLEREVELVVSVLAVLKTGAAYLPLDPAYPHDRILYMIEDSAAAIVITTPAITAALNLPGDKVFWLDAPAPSAAAVDLPQASADSGAYVIYTSGSTGRPKGVVVLHRNVLNFFSGMTQRVPADPAGRWLAVTSLSFDISVLELLWTLTRGLSVVLYSATAKVRSNVPLASIADEIAQNRITHLQCTPSMASMLVADSAGRAALGRLDVLMVGGEALTLPLARQLRALLPGKFLNMYGPTETTVWSTTCDLAQIGDFIALGQPIANTRLHIRTPGGLECPALVAGELLIGGAGVTPGYWQRPELTAERFIADPAQPGARLYRTGDLVRRHPNGQLEFLGRIDHQVKLRGHRIELGEIEGALLRQPGVKEAVVIVHEDTMGEKRLVGYLTPTTSAAPDIERIRAALKCDLPEIMVPTVLLVLPALPLTPNNKVDRRALPPPRAATAPLAAAPETVLEKRIAAIWQEALGLDTVGVTDNFFDLGGHSLLVVQVQHRLRETCGHEVSITDMFRLLTVRALAAHLNGQGASAALGEGQQRANARRAMRERTAPVLNARSLRGAAHGSIQP